MSAEQPDPADRSIAAEGPHCGVCDHVYFGDDWERTPYCTEHERAASIRVNDVCSAFVPKDGIDIEPATIDDEIAIEWAEQTTGDDAPFYAAYRDDDRYTWLCGSCRTLDVAVGPMGQLECSECENEHTPREWDAAYM